MEYGGGLYIKNKYHSVLLLKKDKTEVRWARVTKKYYINKGYKYTKLGETFTCKVIDLPWESKHKLGIICPNCKRVREIAISKIFGKSSSGDSLCPRCSQIENLEHHVFGNLSVLKLDFDSFFENPKRKIRWICKCSCKDKTVKSISASDLKSGGTISCGCIGLKNRLKTNLGRTGKNSPLWKGNSNLVAFLRRRNNNWREEIIRNHRYTCDNCKSKELLQVHHLYSFSNFVVKMMEGLSIPIYAEMDQYSIEQLDTIFLEYNSRLSSIEGVCLCIGCHILFHQICGNSDSTKEEYIEFKKMNLRPTNMDELREKEEFRVKNQQLKKLIGVRRGKLSKRNKSGYTGVSFSKRENKYQSSIIVNSKRIHLGWFVDKEEAIQTRKDAELKYYDEF